MKLKQLISLKKETQGILQKYNHVYEIKEFESFQELQSYIQTIKIHETIQHCKEGIANICEKIENESSTGGAASFNLVEGENIEPAISTSPSKKWIMPAEGKITSEYNEQRTGYKHNGIDIYLPIGTPVKAIADGTVVVCGPAEGYGYWVGINHGVVNGVKVSSEYGHLSKWCVNVGQKVKQGQVIAYSGNTGRSSGPHLHLTIRHGNPGKGAGVAVSPWQYISR